MINGGHVILYSRDAEADRAFFPDVLGYPHVDAGGGWLIFKLPPAEIAVHPTDGPEAQEFFLMCDDVDVTVRELTARGVEFTQPVTEAGWGRQTRLRLPAVARPACTSPATSAPPTSDRGPGPVAPPCHLTCDGARWRGSRRACSGRGPG